MNHKPKVRQRSDTEINTREFNGQLVGLAEDRTKYMMKSDSTSKQYIIYIIDKGRRKHKCYITDLGVKKMRFENAKHFATHIFNNLEQYEDILGCNWGGYQVTEEFDMAV